MTVIIMINVLTMAGHVFLVLCLDSVWGLEGISICLGFGECIDLSGICSWRISYAWLADVFTMKSYIEKINLMV